MKIFAPLFLILLTITQSNAGTVQRTEDEEDVKQYDIEVLIFEDAHARYINSELWPQKAIDQDDVTQSPVPVELPPEETKSFTNIKPGILQHEYNRINHSSEYNVLFYGAWRQTGLEKSQAFDIDINELENIHQSRSDNSITGHFRVVLARYLHFYSELEYHADVNARVTDTVTDAGTGESGMNVNKSDVLKEKRLYPMKNHRRMRSKELHYIDHPLVGILVQINTAE